MDIETPKIRKKLLHSRFGIASCIIGLVTWIFFASVAIYGVNINTYNESDFDKFLVEHTLLFFFVVPLIGHFIGFVLGIVGAFQSNAKRVFAIIGIILNLNPFILFILFIYIYLGITGQSIKF